MAQEETPNLIQKMHIDPEDILMLIFIKIMGMHSTMKIKLAIYQETKLKRRKQTFQIAKLMKQQRQKISQRKFLK